MEKDFSSIVHDKLVIFLTGFLLSVFISSFAPFGVSAAGSLLILALSMWVYGTREIEDEIFRKKVLIVSIFICACSIGMLRYIAKDFHIIDPYLLAQKEKTASLEVTIISEPREKASYREYIGTLNSYGKEKILVRADLYPEFMYGDKVLFTGTLDEPRTFETETGRVFDYPAYLSKDDIYLILAFAEGSLLSKGNGNVIKEKLFTFKNAFIEKLERNIPDPESSLLSGILLGSEDSLGKEWEDRFRTTGISHIVVLSGYNITLVAESVLKLLTFLPLRAALLGSSIGIILFTLAVGGGASVVRASSMALLVILARATGRKYMIGRALLIVGGVMVFINPKVLVFDFGFQLSFLATIALIWLAPLLSPCLEWCPDKGNLREILSATLATQVTVLPLLLYTTGIFSIMSFPVNMLILPFVPLTMFLGFVTGAVGFLGSWLAFPFGVISQFLLLYILKIVELFSSLQFLTLSLHSFSWIFLVITYGALGYFFLRLKIWQERRLTKKSASL